MCASFIFSDLNESSHYKSLKGNHRMFCICNHVKKEMSAEKEMENSEDKKKQSKDVSGAPGFLSPVELECFLWVGLRWFRVGAEGSLTARRDAEDTEEAEWNGNRSRKPKNKRGKTDYRDCGQKQLQNIKAAFRHEWQISVGGKEETPGRIYFEPQKQAHTESAPTENSDFHKIGTYIICLLCWCHIFSSVLQILHFNYHKKLIQKLHCALLLPTLSVLSGLLMIILLSETTFLTLG